MLKPKIYKILTVLVLVSVVGGIITYTQLSNRHKAIVKTQFLHRTGLLDNEWAASPTAKTYSMISPTFLIDDVYASMEGPKSSKYIQLSQDSAIVWITGFDVKAIDAKTKKTISNDFICHTNIDFNAMRYFSNFNLEDRIGKQFPRLTSLSNGMEQFSFPKGYGVPMRGNDMLYISTESLNHNHKDINYLIKHRVSFDYSTEKNLKPLMSRTIFIMLPYDQENPFKTPDVGTDLCIPVETKNHIYQDANGTNMSGHWVIPRGKNTYRSPVSHQLMITDSLRLHAAAVHVHPFATSVTLFDKTTKSAVFTSKVLNYKDKTGIIKVEDFISEAGIWLYADHDYELVLQVNNTSKIDREMMASLFLFFYDKELEAIVSTMK